MPALDTTSALVLLAGTKQQAVLPLLPGSVYEIDPNVHRAPQAINFFSSVNYVSGLVQPVIYARCRVFSNWFSWGWMSNFFLRTIGFLPSVGPVWFKVAGKSAAIQFAACKLQQLCVTWNSDDALLAELILLPYGGRQNPFSLSFPRPTGPAWPSQAVGLEGWNGVVAGKVTLNNRLVPDRGWPFPQTIDGNWYPRDYYAGSLVGNLSLVQQSTGAALDNENGQSQWIGSVHFYNATRSQRTTFRRMSLMAPTTAYPTRGGVQLVTRSYDTILFNPSGILTFDGNF